MAAAPLIGLGLSAASTVSGMAAQSKQAKAQQASINASNLAAQQQADLMEQRLNYSRQSAEETYFRERVLLDRQRDASQLQLEQAKIQEEMNLRQQGFGIKQAEATAEIRMEELLTAASQQRTQGGLVNTQQFLQLAEQLTGSRAAADNLLRVSAMSGLGGESFDALQQQNFLNDIEAIQMTQEAANTTNRIASTNASNIEKQADVQGRTNNTMIQLYKDQLERQRQFNAFSLERMPGILELQTQRNEKALEADKYAQQAALSIQSQANQANLSNTLAANQAQASGIQGPNVLAGIASIGSSLYSFGQQGGFSLLGGGQQTLPNAPAPLGIGGTPPFNPANTSNGRNFLTGNEYSGFVPGNFA